MTGSERKRQRNKRFECGHKLVHPNYLSAMLHVKRLERRPRGPAPMVIYPCSYCDGIHVGHHKTFVAEIAKARRQLKKLNKTLEHPRFQECAPLYVRQHLARRREVLLRIAAGTLPWLDDIFWGRSDNGSTSVLQAESGSSILPASTIS